MARGKPTIEVNLDSIRRSFSSVSDKKSSKDSSVKIDSGLLEEVEAFINLEDNKFRYANRKQFIDLAVSDFLRREKRRMK